MTWAGEFVAAMLEERALGADFDLAYALALKRHPVRYRELGPAPRTLLDEDPEVWWRAVCERAWRNAPALDGSPSRLHLLPGVVDSLPGVDLSRPARHTGRHAAAA